MKPFDIKESPYIDFDAENNDKDQKFKIGDQVRISNHKNSFAKRCTSNSEEDVFVIKKVKKCCSWNFWKALWKKITKDGEKRF